MRGKLRDMCRNISEKALPEALYRRAFGVYAQQKIGQNYPNFMSLLARMIGWYVTRPKRSMQQWKHASKPKRQ